jgi:hypothetical protein
VLRGWDGKMGEWTATIAQREFCFQTGAMMLALNAEQDDPIDRQILQAFSAINYFGRRGSFLQLTNSVWEAAAPEAFPGFVNLCQPAGRQMIAGFLQRMDNMRTDATFEDVSIFNPRGNGGRESYTVILPYQLKHHGFNHTVYALSEQHHDPDHPAGM